MGCMVSYGLTVQARTDFLPVDATLSVSTVRTNALAVAQRCEGVSGMEASRAIDEKGAMAMPLPFVQCGWLHRATEALEEEGEEVEREFGTSLAVGRRTEPQARQMG
jgi:hypothetical protein